MTRQTLPYPTWPVFWGFTLCSVLSGVAFVFPKEFSLPFGHSGALETSIIVAIILTPIAILASIFIILFQTYREKIGILTSMLICISDKCQLFSSKDCYIARIHYLTHCIASQTNAYRKRRFPINPTE